MSGESSSWLISVFRFCWFHKLKIFLGTSTVVLLFVIYLFLAAWFVWQGQKEVVIANLERFSAEVTDGGAFKTQKPIIIQDIHQKVIGKFFRNKFRPIRVDNLKEHENLVWAVLASEDRVFYSHFGVNLKALFRAIWINLSQMRLSQGGSTVTQQLSKLTLNMGQRSLFKKIVELYCSLYIESRHSKDTILAMYLNQVFLGKGNYGMEEASRYYFRKSASSLSMAEAAVLAGTIQAPSVFNPVRNIVVALKKQSLILQAMVEHPELNLANDLLEKDIAKKLPSLIKKFKKYYKVRKEKKFQSEIWVSDIGIYGYDKDFTINLAHDINREIRSFVLRHFTDEEFQNKTLIVQTTIDFKKQAWAQSLLHARLEVVKEKLRKRKLKYLKKNKKKLARQENKIINTMNGSVVSINPHNGYIEAIVGSDRISSVYHFNRALMARRQPGSAIKGLVYAMAFDRREITPSSLIVDEKINFNGYSPRNWYGKFKGEMTARRALALSVNTIAVKMLHRVGVDNFLDTLADIINIDRTEARSRFLPNLSLALGAGELTPMELALVYATIANGGKKVLPVKILRILDEEDEVLYEHEKPSEQEQLLNPIACAMALNGMQAVMSKQGTLPTRLTRMVEVGGKTGTVQSPKAARKTWGNRKGVRDVWFAGVLPNLVTTIWIGNDSGAPFPGSGGSVAGRTFIEYALKMQAAQMISGTFMPDVASDEIARLQICGDNGLQMVDGDECKYPLRNQYYFADDVPSFIAHAEPEPEDESLISEGESTTSDATIPNVSSLEENNEKVVVPNEGVELAEPIINMGEHPPLPSGDDF